VRAPVVDEFLAGPGHLAGGRLVLVDDLPVASDLHRYREIVGIDGLCGGDAGTDRATPVVHLRLREIERVIALYFAAAHVVADGVADDPSVVRDDGEFGFRHVPRGVPADADGLVRTDRPTGGRLEEDLRSLGLVNVQIDFGHAALFLPCGLADLVGDARGPHLFRDDGQQRLGERSALDRRGIVSQSGGHLVDAGPRDVRRGGEVAEVVEAWFRGGQVVGVVVVGGDEAGAVAVGETEVSHGGDDVPVRHKTPVGAGGSATRSGGVLASPIAKRFERTERFSHVCQTSA